MTGVRSRTAPEAPGVLEQDAERPGEVGVGGDGGDAQVDSEWLGAGAQHVEGLRQAVGVGEEDVPGLPGRGAPGQGHRLGGGAGLIQQGGVGDRQAGEVGHHRLEVEQRLQAALGDLRLIGGVGGVPGRAFQDVAADHGGRDRVVEAQADHRGAHGVARGEAVQLGDGLGLGQRLGQGGQGRGRRAAGRQGRLHQRVEGAVAERGEHRPLLVGRGADVAGSELRQDWDVSGSFRHRRSLLTAPRLSPAGSRAAYPVRSLVPERFRGGVAPSALRRLAGRATSAESLPAGMTGCSPAYRHRAPACSRDPVATPQLTHNIPVLRHRAWQSTPRAGSSRLSRSCGRAAGRPARRRRR